LVLRNNAGPAFVMFPVRFSVAGLIAFAAAVGSAAAAEPSYEEKVATLYRPFEAESVTLAPDGRHVAYTRHVKNDLAVVIVDVEDPTQRSNLVVDEDRAVAFSKEKAPAQLRYLRWMSPNRLVIVPTEETISLPVLEGRPSVTGNKIIAPIMAVDADGSNAKQLAGEADFSVQLDLARPGAEDRMDVSVSRHTTILGRIPGDPNHLLVAALGRAPLTRDTGMIPTTLFKIDVNTGKVVMAGEEFELGQFLYDWQGQARVSYLQPEHSLTRKFGHRLPGGRWREPGNGPGSLPPEFTLSVKNYFGPRAEPLGFDADSKVLVFASNVGRDTFGIYGLNVETGQRTSLALEHPYFDLAPLEPAFPSSSLVFDPTTGKLAGVRATGVTPLTMWVETDLAATQRTLEKKFPRRTVEILEWDEARMIFLARVTGGSEPGRYFIYKKKENLAVEFLRRAPWLKAADLSDSMPIEFDTPAGVHLTGYLTLPRSSRLKPPPLLVYLPGGFPARAQPEFDREAQLLARMGFVVVRVNHRGTEGFGAKHRDAIQAGADRVPVDDILATIDYVASRQPIDRRRIATMGEGFGGYLALRALQLEPDRFRCAVAINAPLDLDQWLREPMSDDISSMATVDFPREVQRAFFQRNARGFVDTSVLRQPERLTKPVLLIVDPHENEEIGLESGRLRSLLHGLQRDAEYVELRSNDFALGLPTARAKVFRQIEEFFNLNLYDYKVKVGEVEEKK
jgi:pimeloyl-ACP methyl ester carboxylesterase